MPRSKENFYHTNYDFLPGSQEKNLIKIARKIYHREEAKTKRTVYIRSNKKSYFKGQKVFLNLFFEHLKQKSYKDRVRRLKCFEIGLDLLKNNPYPPVSCRKSQKSEDIFLRFKGVTKDNEVFFVQVRRNTRGNHFWMSAFPEDKA